MPELEITDEQAAFLDALRDAIEAEIVGPYGTVQRQDALQYLIDHYGEPADLLDEAPVDEPGADREPDLEVGDASDADATFSEDDADAGEESTADDGNDEQSPSGGVDPAAAAEAAAEIGSDGDEGDGDSGEVVESGSPAPTPGGGGGKLDEMMSLLDDHDDKWREADTQETKYEVELPDGDVETVQTKDDVRALLFKNY